MHKFKVASILLGFVLVLSACNDEKEKTEMLIETDKAENQDQVKTKNENITDKSDTVSKDEDIQKELEKEDGVLQVSLSVTEDSGGFVIVDFEVEDDMDEKQANAIAEKYAKKIKEKYEDSGVDVQARKNGDTFAQVTIEKE